MAKIRSFWCVCISLLKFTFKKLLHPNGFYFTLLNSCPLSTKISIENGGKLVIGERLAAQKNLEFVVRRNSSLTIGNRVSFNRDCLIVCHNNISIGDNVIFGPGCKLFDHNHDFRKKNEERRLSSINGEITIGNGVWFGANCVILKGTQIGDNCVFSACSVIKGKYPDNVIVFQEKAEKIQQIKFY
jgi:acetyltransferase-like isoleucine patch superfamily enzyme